MRLPYLYGSLNRHQEREIRVMALELRIAVRMAVHRNHAVGVFHDDVAVGIHAERPHKVAVALRAVNQLRLVHLRGNMVPDLVGHLHAHADIHLVVQKLHAEAAAFVAEPLRPRAARRDNQIFRLNALAVLHDKRVRAFAVGLDVRHRRKETELRLFPQIGVHLLQHLQIVLGAEVTHAGVQEMQVVCQRELLDLAALGGENLRRRAVLLVDLIHIVDETHDFLVVEVFVEPAAELRREIVLAVGKRARAAKPAHDAARYAADAALDLPLRDRAAPLVDVLAAFENDNLKSRFFCQKLISSERARRPRADNGHVVLLRSHAFHSY